MRYLSIDIGGTKTTVALVEIQERVARIVASETYQSQDIETLDSILAHELVESVAGLGVGIAGPVANNVAKITNLSWGVDGNVTAQKYGRPVVLMNDMVAHTYGIMGTSQDHFPLYSGTLVAGSYAVMGVGTGLGECIAFWDGEKHTPCPTEGGHTDFSPMTEQDVELWNFMRKRYEHISWERIVSGSDGFNNLTRFHLHNKTAGYDAWSKVDLEQPVASQINKAGIEGDLFARQVMQDFVRLLGCELGNLALKSMAVGGLYVTGGVAPKIKTWFKDPLFRRGFLAKGRFADLLQQIPIYLVEDQDLAIKGAAFGVADLMRRST